MQSAHWIYNLWYNELTSAKDKKFIFFPNSSTSLINEKNLSKVGADIHDSNMVNATLHCE